VDKNSDKIYLITELMHYGTLQDVLIKKGVNIESNIKIKFAIDIAKGLAYLHENNPKIIHRDLKPANCLVDNKWTVKISDFGLSTIKTKHDYTMTSVGTPIYMAPEVISKSRYSESADIYSLGIVLYEIFTGITAYSDKSDKNIMNLMMDIANNGLRPTMPDDINPAIKQIILECLDKNPETRPTAIELVMRLKRVKLAEDLRDSVSKNKTKASSDKFSINVS